MFEKLCRLWWWEVICFDFEISDEGRKSWSVSCELWKMADNCFLSHALEHQCLKKVLEKVILNEGKGE